MPSSWILARTTSSGAKRYHVRYRLGGRGTAQHHGGSFPTKSEAFSRKRWIDGELAAMRVPDFKILERPTTAPTFAAVAEAWRRSRLDVAASTAETHRINLGRILPRLGTRAIDKLTAADVAEFVTELAQAGLKRETIRKTIATLAMVLDYAGRTPNPARDHITVRLPREIKAEINPPTAEHVIAVCRLLPQRYRLPLLVLDATGMRVGELEALTWADVDEQRERWRVSRAVAKTGQARWVAVPETLFSAVTVLVPRDDRVPDRPVFQGVTADRLRTAISRACIAAGVPAFSPHDLRHRRISLEHLRGQPWARIGQLVGQRNLAVTANTYTHVLADETEIDYARTIASSRLECASVVEHG